MPLRILNSDSLIRSAVGLVDIPRGDFKFNPRAFPAIIRITVALYHNGIVLCNQEILGVDKNANAAVIIQQIDPRGGGI